MASSSMVTDLQSKLPQECLDQLVEAITADRIYCLSEFVRLPPGQPVPDNHWYFYFINGNFRRPGDTFPRLYKKCRGSEVTRQVYCLPRRGLNEYLYCLDWIPTLESTIYSTIAELPNDYRRRCRWTCLDMRDTKNHSGWGEPDYPLVPADIYVPPTSLQSLSQLTIQKIITSLSSLDLITLLNIPDISYDLTTFVEYQATIPVDETSYWYLCFDGEKYLRTYPTLSNCHQSTCQDIRTIYRLPRLPYNQLFYTDDSRIVKNSILHVTIIDPILVVGKVWQSNIVDTNTRSAIRRDSRELISRPPTILIPPPAK